MNRGQQGTQEIQQEQMSSPATGRQGPAEMKAGGTGKQLLGAALGTGGASLVPGLQQRPAVPGGYEQNMAPRTRG